MTEFGGQVVSIGPVYSDFLSKNPATPLFDTCVFLSEGDSTATFLPDEGDCGGNVYNDVVNLIDVPEGQRWPEQQETKVSPRFSTAVRR